MDELNSASAPTTPPCYGDQPNPTQPDLTQPRRKERRKGKEGPGRGFAWVPAWVPCLRACLRACMHACVRPCLRADRLFVFDIDSVFRAPTSCTSPRTRRTPTKHSTDALRRRTKDKRRILFKKIRSILSAETSQFIAKEKEGNDKQERQDKTKHGKTDNWFICDLPIN